MPLRSGGALDNEYARGKTNLGLMGIGIAFKGEMSRIGALGLGVDVYTDAISGPIAVGSALYIAQSRSPYRIFKINLATFTIEDTLDLGTGHKTSSLVVYDGFLYAGHYTAPGKIVKIDLSTFTIDSTLTLDTGENYIGDLHVGSDGFLYAGLDVGPGIVVKVNLSTFTKEATLTLAENSAISFADDGTFLYVSSVTSAPRSRVVKISLATFTRIAAITFPEILEYDDYSSLLNAILIDGAFLYASYNPVDYYTSKIGKIDLNTFTITDTLAHVRPMAFKMAVADGHLYSPSIYDPGYVWHIDLATFSLVESLELESGEEYAKRLVEKDHFLYVVCAWPTGTATDWVVKVKLT